MIKKPKPMTKSTNQKSVVQNGDGHLIKTTAQKPLNAPINRPKK